jgi:hypothetical protein
LRQFHLFAWRWANDQAIENGHHVNMNMFTAFSETKMMSQSSDALLKFERCSGRKVPKLRMQITETHRRAC